MNLLSQKWIPVLHQNGLSSLIAPYQLTDEIDTNPIMKLNVPRADFNGSLIQLLIGLLQTALPNLKAQQWRKWQKQPPSSAELKNIFSSLAANFNLFGDGPRFMQDLNLSEENPQSIAALLIEQPGQQTIKHNTDHFIKRNQIQQLCPGCAAAALFTLQVNAPAGGSGHRTSMRGGGPLTTLVVSNKQQEQTLWHKLWFNVLLQEEFESVHQLSSEEVQNKPIFPWLSVTITSENDQQVHPSNTNPLQLYWSMPRRIRLLPINNQNQSCSLCGTTNDIMVKDYVTKNYGVNYSEHWRHTLSPYLKNKEGNYFPMHPQPGGISYKHWLTIAISNSAYVVKVNQQRLSEDKQELGTNDPGSEIKIWAFGYDMDNMKARCWYESHMPFYNIPLEQTEIILSVLNQLIKAADQARLYLNAALTACSISNTAANQLIWQQTEAKFYSLVNQITSSPTPFNEQAITTAKLVWLKHIKDQALAIFDQLAQLNYPELIMYKNHVTAQKKLRHSFSSKNMLSILDLEKVQQGVINE